MPSIPVAKNDRFKRGFCTWTAEELVDFINHGHFVTLSSLRFKLLDLGMYKCNLDRLEMHNEYMKLPEEKRTILYTDPCYLYTKAPTNIKPKKILKQYKDERFNSADEKYQAYLNGYNENNTGGYPDLNRLDFADIQQQTWNDLNEDFKPQLYLDGYIIKVYKKEDIQFDTNANQYTVSSDIIPK